MKKYLFIILLLSFTQAISAQSEFKTSKKAFYRYAMVSFDTKWGKYQIYLQEGSSKDEPDPLMNEDGNILQFPTWIDAMNYLSLQGWEIAWHNSNTNMMEQWILKKELTEEELKAIVKDNTTIKQKR